MVQNIVARFYGLWCLLIITKWPLWGGNWPVWLITSPDVRFLWPGVKYCTWLLPLTITNTITNSLTATAYDIRVIYLHIPFPVVVLDIGRMDKHAGQCLWPEQSPKYAVDVDMKRCCHDVCASHQRHFSTATSPLEPENSREVINHTPTNYWITNWSHTATRLAVLVVVVSDAFKKRSKAPSFQIGSGWNLARLFFK